MAREQDESRMYRRALVETLRREGHLSSPRVTAALLSVPRELFVPGLPLEEVYRPSDAIVIKRVDGVSVSSVSAPEVIALMLEQLNPQPGDHILEIGAGSGYNAALLAHLVGETGKVVSLDIDEDLVADARDHLAAAGYPQVDVVQTDGALGLPAERAYDGIILTVASSDIPAAWYEQLARPHGRLVLPLALHALQRCVVFVPEPGEASCLVTWSPRTCSFIALRGLLGTGPPRVQLDEEGGWVLVADQETLPLTREDIGTLLSGPLHARGTGVRAGAEELRSGLHLWLVAHEPNVFTLWSTSRLPDLFGLAERAGAHGSLCLIDADQPGLALLTWAGSELSVLSPSGSEGIADRLRALVNEWDSHGRPMDADARIRACPRSSSGVPGTDEVAIDQHWTRFVLSWARSNHRRF
jgi:protein-L-isoaspartate(D-aspartate) O-methyltransferase